MTLVSVSEAARLADTDRSYLYKAYINTGKISVHRDENGRPKIDTAEILRVFGELKTTETTSPQKIQQSHFENTSNEIQILKEKIEALESISAEKEKRIEEKNSIIAEKNKEIEYQRERVHNLETRYDRLIEDKQKTEDLTAQLSEQIEILHFQQQKKWWHFW